MDDTTLYTSGITYPYSSFGLFAPDGPATQFDGSTLAPTDYFEFFPTTDPDGDPSYGMELFAADGTSRGVTQEWGDMYALGDEFLFYLGTGDWGTVVTTGAAFEHGSSVQFAVTAVSPTIERLEEFTSCSDEPIGLVEIGPDLPVGGGVDAVYPGFTVQVTGAAAPAFSVSAGALPPGLALDPATGIIQGTPTQVGDFTFTVLVTDANGTASKEYTIAVAAVTPPIDPPIDPPVDPGGATDALAESGSTPAVHTALIVGTVLVLGGAALLRQRPGRG